MWMLLCSLLITSSHENFPGNRASRHLQRHTVLDWILQAARQQPRSRVLIQDMLCIRLLLCHASRVRLGAVQMLLDTVTVHEWLPDSFPSGARVQPEYCWRGVRPIQIETVIRRTLRCDILTYAVASRVTICWPRNILSILCVTLQQDGEGSGPFELRAAAQEAENRERFRDE